jgi:hypothetical protein
VWGKGDKVFSPIKLFLAFITLCWQFNADADPTLEKEILNSLIFRSSPTRELILSSQVHLTEKFQLSFRKELYQFDCENGKWIALNKENSGWIEKCGKSIRFEDRIGRPLCFLRFDQSKRSDSLSTFNYRSCYDTENLSPHWLRLMATFNGKQTKEFWLDVSRWNSDRPNDLKNGIPSSFLTVEVTSQRYFYQKTSQINIKLKNRGPIAFKGVEIEGHPLLAGEKTKTMYTLSSADAKCLDQINPGETCTLTKVIQETGQHLIRVNSGGDFIKDALVDIQATGYACPIRWKQKQYMTNEKEHSNSLYFRRLPSHEVVIMSDTSKRKFVMPKLIDLFRIEGQNVLKGDSYYYLGGANRDNFNSGPLMFNRSPLVTVELFGNSTRQIFASRDYDEKPTSNTQTYNDELEFMKLKVLNPFEGYVLSTNLREGKPLVFRDKNKYFVLLELMNKKVLLQKQDNMNPIQSRASAYELAIVGFENGRLIESFGTKGILMIKPPSKNGDWSYPFRFEILESGEILLVSSQGLTFRDKNSKISFMSVYDLPISDARFSEKKGHFIVLIDREPDLPELKLVNYSTDFFQDKIDVKNEPTPIPQPKNGPALSNSDKESFLKKHLWMSRPHFRFLSPKKGGYLLYRNKMGNVANPSKQKLTRTIQVLRTNEQLKVDHTHKGVGMMEFTIDEGFDAEYQDYIDESTMNLVVLSGMNQFSLSIENCD